MNRFDEGTASPMGRTICSVEHHLLAMADSETRFWLERVSQMNGEGVMSTLFQQYVTASCCGSNDCP